MKRILLALALLAAPLSAEEPLERFSYYWRRQTVEIQNPYWLRYPPRRIVVEREPGPQLRWQSEFRVYQTIPGTSTRDYSKPAKRVRVFEW